MAAIAALGEGSVPEAVLYLLGLAGLVLAGAAMAWALLRRRALWLRILAAVVAAVLAWLLLQLMDVVGDAVIPGSGWFQEESSVWLTATLALVGGVLLLGQGVRGPRQVE